MTNLLSYAPTTHAAWFDLADGVRAVLPGTQVRVEHDVGGLWGALAAAGNDVVALEPADHGDLRALTTLAAWFWDKDVLLVFPAQGMAATPLLTKLQPRVVLHRPLQPSDLVEVLVRLLQRCQRRTAAWPARKTG